MKKPKSKKNFSNIIGKTAWEIFKFFCYKDLEEVEKLIRGDKSVNLPKIYFEENKSSFKHFYRYFPCEDLNFKKIVDKLASPLD